MFSVLKKNKKIIIIIKLEPFVILFSYDIVISVIRFVLIPLLRQQCFKKIKQQTAQALA